MKVYISPSNQKANTGVGDYGNEMQRMYELAEILRPKLEKYYEVLIPYSYQDLATRATMSDNWGSDIYVALHTNAGGKGIAKGCEIYAYSTESKGYNLAQNVYARIESIARTKGRGIKFKTLYETTHPKAPAILIEFVFHDNIDDVNYYLANKEKFADAVVQGIKDYFGTPEPTPTPEPQPTPTPTPTPTQKFNIGDRVEISGKLYVSSNSETHSGTVGHKITNITRYNDGSKHPYNTSGDLGWMDEEDIKLYTEKEESFKIGDVVVPIKLVDYRGTSLIQYDEKYEISQIDNRGAVLRAIRGDQRPIWAVLPLSNIKKI